MKARSRTIAIVGACALAIVLAAGAEAASSKKKSHSSATPIPTGKDAQFTVDQITFYGYFDNSPPGLAIAHPVIHGGAGGIGTFENPISFAVAPQVQKQVPAGTIMYIPSLQKYFVMEDDCTDSGPGGEAVQGQGCDGELLSGKNEFDLWIDGDPKPNAKDNPGSGTGNTNKNMTSCEDKLTKDNVTVIMNASDGKLVDTTPMLNNGKCSPLPTSTPVTTPPSRPTP
ncbi:MAG TPA: hypothetical protein VNO35_02370 [Steroidobacteraceae bacterium]|nr:hypothetical protein [Steroidobacteraceae bacterium]